MGDGMTVHIGILYLDLFLGEAQSLKDRRMVLKSIKDKVRHKFNVSVAQLDQEDKWQAAKLGFCMIGSDTRYIDKELQHVVLFVESFHAAEICRQEIEFI